MPVIGRVSSAATGDCWFIELGTVPEALGLATDSLIEPQLAEAAGRVIGTTS
jgi:hypothetical protein